MPLPPHHRRSGTLPPVARLLRGATVAGTLALLPTTAACTAGEDDGAEKNRTSRTAVTAAPEAGVVAPAKVEVIAGLIGCRPKIRVEAEELRQGVCHTKERDRVITTFPAERYKLAWLDAAAGYGGKYLVGSRWVVAAEPEALEGMRQRLGGEIRQLSGFGPTAAR
ncbi:hypothetical protein ABT052_09545 [Streptomyces sp. NPDC002766]|uniref:hypothetical protein n=1 Tax=Streptomyces sp. NPDC002766 TaxID=3154429 RepID=UPI00332FC4D6